MGKIMPEDLEKVTPKIEKGDIVIINSSWHKHYADHPNYFLYSPGLYKEAGEWFMEKGVKAVGVDQQALEYLTPEEFFKLRQQNKRKEEVSLII